MWTINGIQKRVLNQDNTNIKVFEFISFKFTFWNIHLIECDNAEVIANKKPNISILYLNIK